MGDLDLVANSVTYYVTLGNILNSWLFISTTLLSGSYRDSSEENVIHNKTFKEKLPGLPLRY